MILRQVPFEQGVIHCITKRLAFGHAGDVGANSKNKLYPDNSDNSSMRE
jgi:hypothetical protein